MSHILVIAPDTDLRRSLEFALRAEGHEVTWRTSIETEENPDRFDCTVLDHHAIGKDLARSAAFCARFKPVILLASYVPHVLSPWVFSILQKPLLGQALVAATREATASRVDTK